MIKPILQFGMRIFEEIIIEVELHGIDSIAVVSQGTEDIDRLVFFFADKNKGSHILMIFESWL